MPIDGRKKNSSLIDEKPAPLQKITTEGTTTAPVQPAAATPAQVQASRPAVTTASPQPIASRPVATSKPPQPAAVASPGMMRPGSISITNPSANNRPSASDTPVTNVVSEPVQTMNKPFTVDELTSAWHQFAGTIPDQSRMVSFIQSTYPQMVSPTMFEVKVNNVLQEREMIRLQPDIHTFIHLRLQNNSIRMQVRVIEEDETARLSTPEDKYKQMAEQNPALEILKNGLGLELD